MIFIFEIYLSVVQTNAHVERSRQIQTSNCMNKNTHILVLTQRTKYPLQQLQHHLKQPTKEPNQIEGTQCSIIFSKQFSIVSKNVSTSTTTREETSILRNGIRLNEIIQRPFSRRYRLAF